MCVLSEKKFQKIFYLGRDLNEEPMKKMNDSKPSDDECFEDDNVEFVGNDNIISEADLKFNSIICKNEQITAV